MPLQHHPRKKVTKNWEFNSFFKMNVCPNCKSDNFALIIRGLDFEEIIEELVKLKKIYLEEFDETEPTPDSKWICNVCLTRWGPKK